jgi:hypothetical protein
MRCLVAGRWTDVGESSGVDVGGDTTSQRGEPAAVVILTASLVAAAT